VVALCEFALCNKNTILPSAQYRKPHTRFFFDPTNFSSLSPPPPTPSDSADAMPIRSKTPTPNAVEEALVVFGEGGFIGIYRDEACGREDAGIGGVREQAVALDGAGRAALGVDLDKALGQHRLPQAAAPICGSRSWGFPSSPLPIPLPSL
jgi:hypothetical protein